MKNRISRFLEKKLKKELGFGEINEIVSNIKRDGSRMSVWGGRVLLILLCTTEKIFFPKQTFRKLFNSVRIIHHKNYS